MLKRIPPRWSGVEGEFPDIATENAEAKRREEQSQRDIQASLKSKRRKQSQKGRRK